MSGRGELFSHSSCLISSARPSRCLPQPPRDDCRGSTEAGSRATNAKAAQRLLKYTNIDWRCRANSVVLKWLIGTQINRVELIRLYGSVPERTAQTYSMRRRLCTHNLLSGIDNSINELLTLESSVSAYRSFHDCFHAGIIKVKPFLFSQ